MNNEVKIELTERVRIDELPCKMPAMWLFWAIIGFTVLNAVLIGIQVYLQMNNPFGITENFQTAEKIIAGIGQIPGIILILLLARGCKPLKGNVSSCLLAIAAVSILSVCIGASYSNGDALLVSGLLFIMQLILGYVLMFNLANDYSGRLGHIGWLMWSVYKWGFYGIIGLILSYVLMDAAKNVPDSVAGFLSISSIVVSVGCIGIGLYIVYLIFKTLWKACKILDLGYKSGITIETIRQAVSPELNILENSPKLHFSWDGDDSGKDNWQMGVYVNGQEVATRSYTKDWLVDIPLSDNQFELKLVVDTGSGKPVTHFKRIFKVDPGFNYSCGVEGSVKKSSGLGVRFCKGDVLSKNAPKVSGSKFMVAFMSLLFPVYGLYKAITDSYMRMSAIAGGAIGFLLGMLVSAMAEEGDKVVFGIGRMKLMEYEPFSFLDIVINFLIGGVASINGLLRLMLESMFG